MARLRVRNEKPAAMLAATELSLTGLTNRVNLAGRQRGLTLRYRKSA